MTNFEKYKEKILNFIEDYGGTPARVDDAFIPCSYQPCENCEYNGAENCVVTFTKWLYEDDGEIDRDTTSCSSCKYTDKTIHEYPCSECRRSYTDKFEPQPRKTRQSEFLKVFPNAKLLDGKVLFIDPCAIDRSYEGKFCEDGLCNRCRESYWSQEVE